MKESRFIELLNLYVDQQLTAAEAVELETEIHSDADRRRTYQQYCRMQKACARLFEQEREGAPASTALARAIAAADRKIIAFPEAHSVWRQRGLYAGGLAAMAACVALVLVRQTPVSAPATPVAATPAAITVAATEPVMPAAQPVTIPAADASVSARPSYFSVLATNRLGSLKTISSNTQVDPAGSQQAFDWMKRVDLPPLRRTEAEAYTFEARVTLPAEKNIFDVRSRRSVQGNVENTAFQFQQ